MKSTRVFILLLIVALCTQCRPNISEEKIRKAAQAPVDTMAVTSFNIERENSPALANWSVFEAGQEVICVPPKWTSHMEDEGQVLVLLPPNSPDSTERVTFTRLAKDSPSLDYHALAQKLATNAFPSFRIVNGDTINKLVFQHDFGVERNVDLLAEGKTYKGYCLIYVNEDNIYEFRIIIDRNRLKSYQGDLFRDIIGNLQVDKHYFIGNDNPLKQIVKLR